jgi:hypothetical protein
MGGQLAHPQQPNASLRKLQQAIPHFKIRPKNKGIKPKSSRHRPKKFITVATMVVVRNNSCPHGSRDAVTNPYSSRFFHSKLFKVFQRHSKQFKAFSMHQFFILSATVPLLSEPTML